MKQILLFLSLAFILLGTTAAQPLKNYAEKVNTLIGTKGKGANENEAYLEAGYTFPGATMPFGMVQFTPTFFAPDKGFVVNQMSGAGCEHMANFPTMPITGALKESPDSMLHLNPNFTINKALAGCYETTTGSGINCKLTSTTRTGMAQYTYSSSSNKATIIIGSGINGTTISKAHIKITSANSCEGYADGGNFCGYPTPYKIYFVAEFNVKSVSSGTWKNKTINSSSSEAAGPVSGAYFTFDVSSKKQIQYKFGISYVSLENAKANLKAENNTWNFDKIKSEAINTWNDYLSRIEVSGGSDDHTTQFYTHLYHAFAQPAVFSDINGEYLGADNKVHKAEGFKYYTSFSVWDTYRTQVQLCAMLAPEETSDMMKSIILFAQQSGGGFPRWIATNVETGIMQGDPTSIFVANAYAFGATDFDTKAALDIMRRGAEIPGTKSQQIEVRPHLEQYLSKGYMNASMQLEYTSADFAIAEFAWHTTHDSALTHKYLKQAQSWKNLYNPQTKWLNSREENGNWKKKDEDWREASFKNYFWMIPYNLKTLIDTIGGKEAAEKRLDTLFQKLNAAYGQDWFAAGNEPDFQVPWTYNWTNAPYKTQQVVHRIINEQYANKNNGLPGNDDLGAMGAWYVFANIGLYPMIPGYGGFSISSPLFPSIKIHLREGTLSIAGGSETKPYISSLNIKGKTWNSTWVDWRDLQNGGTIGYTLLDSANKTWDIITEPPSFDF